MLFSAESSGWWRTFFGAANVRRWSWDPVMVSTSGCAVAEIVGDPGLARMNCCRWATLVHAERGGGRDSHWPADSRAGRFASDGAPGGRETWLCALNQGGHLSSSTEALDIFYDGRTELLLSAPFVRGVSTHGTRLHLFGGDHARTWPKAVNCRER